MGYFVVFLNQKKPIAPTVMAAMAPTGLIPCPVKQAAATSAVSVISDVTSIAVLAVMFLLFVLRLTCLCVF